MHAGEVSTDTRLVRRLLASRFPQWAELPISPVRSVGTVNSIYRIGDDLCVRMPRVAEWAGDLSKECRWLPKLAPHLTLRIPEPVAMEQPDDDFPFAWAVYRWLDGEIYSRESVADERLAATDLANFVSGIRRIEITGDEPRGGRQPLRELDEETREAILASSDFIDSDAAMSAWDDALDAPEWNGKPVWIHADLLPPNLLVQYGRIVAVIDFGSVGVGDPAADVIPAWSVFGSEGRKAFRTTLDVRWGMWRRARGYALHQAAMIIPYYRQTNPDFVEMASRTIGEVLEDFNPDIVI